jgi:hypothetical protein
MEAVCSSENGLHGVISQKIVLFRSTTVEEICEVDMKKKFGNPRTKDENWDLPCEGINYGEDMLLFTFET